MATATQNSTTVPKTRDRQPLAKPQIQELPTPLTSEAQTFDREPEQEEIALLAYTYWLERASQGAGENEGSAEEDWLRAERELRAR